MPSHRAGRPPQFDRTAAVRTALGLFWRQGYNATSLDDLTSAMGIGRSSFYASFGSKHSALLEALEMYRRDVLQRVTAAAAATDDPADALLAVLEIVACTGEPMLGCLFANTIGELLPDDHAVADVSRRHLDDLDRVVVALVERLGFSTDEARARGGALLALATGAVTLRKSGESSRRIRAMLDRMPAILAWPTGSRRPTPQDDVAR